MSIVIPKSPHCVIALALGRGGKDFSERDRLLLDSLRPHLAQAHGNAATLARLQQESARQNPAKDTLLTSEAFERLGLTDREAEILEGIARGQTNHQIAASLYVSPFTVKTHLQRVYRKLGVGSRSEALARALKCVGLPGRARTPAPSTSRGLLPADEPPPAPRPWASRKPPPSFR